MPAGNENGPVACATGPFVVGGSYQAFTFMPYSAIHARTSPASLIRLSRMVPQLTSVASSMDLFHDPALPGVLVVQR